MRIKELKGLNSVRVYQLYQQVLIALGIYPTTQAKDLKTFINEFDEKNIDEKREMLRAAVMLFNFDREDLKSILDFAISEPQGIEVSQIADGMSPDKIADAVTYVLLKASEVKVFFWIPTVQKKSKTSQSV